MERSWWKKRNTRNALNTTKRTAKLKLKSFMNDFISFLRKLSLLKETEAWHAESIIRTKSYRSRVCVIETSEIILDWPKWKVIEGGYIYKLICTIFTMITEARYQG